MSPGEESFSWSSFDFNSSFRLYSSDDDNNINIDPDAYIELELDSSIRKDFEFCVSVPICVPFTKTHSSPANNRRDGKLTVDEVVGSTSRVSTGNCSNLLFRLIRNVRPQRSFSKPVGEGGSDSDDDHKNNCYTNLELVRSRRASPTPNKISMGSNKIMNLMRSIIFSLHPTSTCSNNNRGPNRKISTWMMPIDNLFSKWRKYDLQSTVAKRTYKCYEKSKSKGVLEDMKLTGLLAKLFVSTGGRNTKVVGRIAMSHPTFTIDPSPVHQSGDATASSVRAAIAHCKKSLGQPDDFRF